MTNTNMTKIVEAVRDAQRRGLGENELNLAARAAVSDLADVDYRRLIQELGQVGRLRAQWSPRRGEPQMVVIRGLGAVA